MCEGATAVTVEFPGTSGEHSVEHGVDVVRWAGEHPFVDGGRHLGLERHPGRDPENLAQLIVDAGPCRIGIGVRGEQRTAGRDEPVHQPPLRGVGGDGIHPAHEWWVVDEQQRRARGDGIVHDLVGRVHRDSHRADAVGGIAGDEPDGVPGFGQGRRVGVLEHGDHLGQRRGTFRARAGGLVCTVHS